MSKLQFRHNAVTKASSRTSSTKAHVQLTGGLELIPESGNKQYKKRKVSFLNTEKKCIPCGHICSIDRIVHLAQPLTRAFCQKFLQRQQITPTPKSLRIVEIKTHKASSSWYNALSLARNAYNENFFMAFTDQEI